MKPGMTEVGTGCPLHTPFLICGANLDRHPSTGSGHSTQSKPFASSAVEMPIGLGVSSMGVSTSLDTNGERAELKATGCRPILFVTPDLIRGPA